LPKMRGNLPLYPDTIHAWHDMGEGEYSERAGLHLSVRGQPKGKQQKKMGKGRGAQGGEGTHRRPWGRACGGVLETVHFKIMKPLNSKIALTFSEPGQNIIPT
jgi:hypothetical protein